MLCGEKAKLTDCGRSGIAGSQSRAGVATICYGLDFFRNKKTKRSCDKLSIDQEHKLED